MSDKFTTMLESIASTAKGAISKTKGTVEKSMTLDSFGDYANTEMNEAISDSDTTRLERLMSQIEHVGKQLEKNPKAEVVKVEIFRDPAQHTNEGDFTGGMKKLSDMMESLKGEVEALKAKGGGKAGEDGKPFPGAKPFGEGGKPEDDEEEKEKQRKAKEEDKADEEEAKRRKAAGESEETDEDKKKRRTKSKKDADAKAKEEADAQAKADAEAEAKIKAEKAGDVRWPADMNKGRERSEAESWGRSDTKKSGNDNFDRSFGDDPTDLR